MTQRKIDKIRCLLDDIELMVLALESVYYHLPDGADADASRAELRNVHIKLRAWRGVALDVLDVQDDTAAERLAPDSVAQQTTKLH